MNLMGAWVIVNDRGQFFGWIHAHVDEWENVTARGVTWVDSWDSTPTYESYRSAERRRLTLPWSQCRTAVVGHHG